MWYKEQPQDQKCSHLICKNRVFSQTPRGTPSSKEECYHLDFSRHLHRSLVQSVMKTGLPSKVSSEWQRAWCVLLCVQWFWFPLTFKEEIPCEKEISFWKGLGSFILIAFSWICSLPPQQSCVPLKMLQGKCIEWRGGKEFNNRNRQVKLGSLQAEIFKNSVYFSLQHCSALECKLPL